MTYFKISIFCVAEKSGGYRVEKFASETNKALDMLFYVVSL